MGYSKTTWVDGDNRYDIKTQASAVISADVKLVYVGTAAGTAVSATNMNNIENGIYNLDTNVWKKLTASTTASAQATINITVPSGYSRLRLYVDDMKTTSATSTSMYITFNNDTSSNYSFNSHSGSSYLVQANQTAFQFNVYAYDGINFSSLEFEIKNVATSEKHAKFSFVENSYGGAFGVFNWLNKTSAISSIQIYASGISLASGVYTELWGCV